MSSIHIGSESEYVKIMLAPAFPSQGWCQADVDIAVSGFHGHIRPWLDADDLQVFASQLTSVYETLQGEATLIPLDQQFTLHVQAQTRGHIHVSGIAWSKATYENKLTFCLELDQSFLPNILAELQRALSAPL